MCGRLLGRVLGHLSAKAELVVVAFRTMDPPEPAVASSVAPVFRCTRCGGVGAVDAVDSFATYTEAGSDDGPPTRRGRGRPPRPFLTRPSRSPLQLALAAL